MLNLQLARKYARALFLLAQEESRLEEYGAQLHQLCDDIAAVPELSAYLSNPSVPKPAKKEVAKSVAKDEGLALQVENFFLLLVDKGRLTVLKDIANEYENFANEALGILVADITTARDLGEPQARSLTAKLSSLTGKKIKLRCHQDAKLVGGMVLRMGDRRIDGSLVTRIQALRDGLLNAAAVSA